MRFSRKADVIFLIIIAATLLSKVHLTRGETDPDADGIAARIATVLKNGGVPARVYRDPPNGRVAMGGIGTCRMWARDYLPYGTFLPYFREQASAFGPLRFAYEGKLHATPPKLGPLLRFYLAREKSRLGLKTNRHPIVAVAASETCNLNAIRWDRVAEVPW